MNRIAVDIGGTFTDCFLVYQGQTVQTKALTTHYNLALGFNEAVEQACSKLNIDPAALYGQLESIRYATTLGTNAVIESKGPRLGLLITHGFEGTVAIGRGRSYGEGLDLDSIRDLSNADRPDPLVPLHLVLSLIHI